MSLDEDTSLVNIDLTLEGVKVDVMWKGAFFRMDPTIMCDWPSFVLRITEGRPGSDQDKRNEIGIHMTAKNMRELRDLMDWWLRNYGHEEAERCRSI